MNLFLDSNIWLALYDSSRRDLQELEKLVRSVETGRVTLLLPEQVVNEVRRNRDKKIANDIAELQAEILLDEIPPIFFGLPEYKSFAQTRRNYERARERLIARLVDDFEHRRLPADHLLDRLFAAGRGLPVTGEILVRARYRYDLGNPPGKEGSYGDAVNWECLLAEIPPGQELHLVTRDRDFASRIDRTRLSPFLEEEWRERKGARIFFYPRLSAFCCDHLPEVRLAGEEASR
jgi:predicted nucleic acid-binding protein